MARWVTYKYDTHIHATPCMFPSGSSSAWSPLVGYLGLSALPCLTLHPPSSTSPYLYACI